MERLGEVDDKYIIESAPSKAKSGKSRIKWAVIGAMGAVAAGIILWQGAKNISNIKTDKKIPDNTKPYDHQIDLPDISNEENIPDIDDEQKTPDSTKTYGQRIEFPEISGELPVINTSGFENSAMGFEGFKSYDVSTLLDGDPSRENCGFTELPVFIRLNTSDHSNGDTYSIEEMDEKLKGIAAQLTDREYVADYENIYGYDYDLSATADDINLKMNAYGNIKIEFENAVDLPDEFGIYSMKNDDAAQITSSLEYLGAKYGNILDLNAPVPSAFIRYDIYATPHATYNLYDDSDDPLTALMNYSFRGLSFEGELIQTGEPVQSDGRSKYDNPDDYRNPNDAYEYTGDLTKIYYTDYLTALEFMGMYPVIGYEKAYEELLSGNYYTTVWDEAYLPDGINPEEVTFTGIAYRRTQDYKYELPYYRFLIELHPERNEKTRLAEGMKEFGAYYVPAVSPEYLIIENTDVALY